MTLVSIVIAALVSIFVVAALFVVSAMEVSVRDVSSTRAHRLRESSERGSKAFEMLVESPGRVGASHALVSGVAFAAIAAMAAVGIFRLAPALSGWVCAGAGVAVAAVLVFSFGEALPRAMAAANPEDVGMALAPAAHAVVIVGYPLARVLSAPWTAFTRMITGEPSPSVPWAEATEGPRSDADAQAADEAEAMMDAFAGLDRKVVREVMVPRTDMVAIEDTDSLAEALVAITAAGVSRVPVFHETLDDIRGILYAKDLLPSLAGPAPDVNLADLARPALFVPETKPVDELLREMRRRTHIAIVADEYGGTAGLVTIEDLLEEIVGEIYDEYDPEVSMVTTLPDGRLRVDARLGIDRVDEMFGTALDVDADTAGGLFTELAGHIPAAGESIEVQGLKFTVEAMEGHRVRQLIVEPAPAREPEE